MTDLQTTPQPLSNAETIISRIMELKESLEANLPSYEAQLFTIHKALQADPDTVHLLTEEQIGIIFSGLSKKKNIVIAEQVTKGNAKLAGGKKLNQATIDDF